MGRPFDQGAVHLRKEMWMDRRTLLKALLASPVATLGHAAPPASMKDIETLQKNWKNFVPAGTAVPAANEPLKLSKEEWRKRLPPEAYKVLREESTERAGTSPLDHETRPGIFVCAGCGLPVFTSEMKFDSGTGWPSFFTSIPGAFETKKDFYLIYPRTEYHCMRCGGHHGHLFDDGPAPTHQRWCNNGVSLRFIPK
jgi:peptide-methionine (R)-S-oxide reductase